MHNIIFNSKGGVKLPFKSSVPYIQPCIDTDSVCSFGKFVVKVVWWYYIVSWYTISIYLYGRYYINWHNSTYPVSHLLQCHQHPHVSRLYFWNNILIYRYWIMAEGWSVDSTAQKIAGEDEELTQRSAARMGHSLAATQTAVRGNKRSRVVLVQMQSITNTWHRGLKRITE